MLCAFKAMLQASFFKTLCTTIKTLPGFGRTSCSSWGGSMDDDKTRIRASLNCSKSTCKRIKEIHLTESSWNSLQWVLFSVGEVQSGCLCGGGFEQEQQGHILRISSCQPWIWWFSLCCGGWRLPGLDGVGGEGDTSGFLTLLLDAVSKQSFQWPLC